MAEATTYQFDLKEATTALIRMQGLTEGTWMLAIQFRFGAGLLDGDSNSVMPGLFAQVPALQLVRPPANGPVPDWAVDASTVEPAANPSQAGKARATGPGTVRGKLKEKGPAASE